MYSKNGLSRAFYTRLDTDNSDVVKRWRQMAQQRSCIRTIAKSDCNNGVLIKFKFVAVTGLGWSSRVQRNYGKTGILTACT